MVATASGELAWCPADELEIVQVDGQAPGEILAGYSTVEAAADLAYPADTPDEVRDHAQYAAFLDEDPDRKHTYDEVLVEQFRDWQRARDSRS